MNRLWHIRCQDRLSGPLKWVPVLGQLQKTLQKGEYLPLRPMPMFESNFVQVTSRGAPVYVHHKTNHLTMGVAASLPRLVLPDLLLIARPPKGRDCSSLILTRMIPLDLVHLYVHNLSARRLKLCLITGRCYYLELDAHASVVAFLFDRWVQLITLLREAATFWAPRTLNTPLLDLAQGGPPASTWRLQDQSHNRGSAIIIDPTIPYKMLIFQKQRKAKTPKRRFKSQAVGDSMPLIWSQLEHSGTRKEARDKKSHPHFGSQTKTQVAGKPSITIRTIFSIVSRTINQKLSASRACSSESDRAMVLGGLVGIPSCCISENSPDISLLFYDHLVMQQDMGDPSDSEASTLSSSSLSQAAHCPKFYLPAPSSSAPRQNKKARPPPSQKTSPVPPTSQKAPFILDGSEKVSAVLAASWNAPARLAALQKTPVPASVPQKVPATPGPSRKTLQVLDTPRKALVIPSLPQKTPHVPGVPQKAKPHPVPNQKSQFLPTPPQKALTLPTQRQRTLDSANLGALPVGSHVETALKRSQPEGKAEPLVLLGTQETKVDEMRARKMSLELPFNTTKKEAKWVMISKAPQIILDGLRGQSKLEEEVPRMEEEKSQGLPGFKSKVTGQQKWVDTQELAVEGAPQGGHRSPFSVKELTFAKMMITANSKKLPLRPEVVGLPSWLLMPPKSTMSVMDPKPITPQPGGCQGGVPVGPLDEGKHGSVGGGVLASMGRNRGREAALEPEVVF